MHHSPRRRYSRLILSLVPLAALLCATHAAAWSYKEHIQFTRIAVARLLADPDTPEPMRQWLRQAVPGVLEMPAEREFFMLARIGVNPSGYGDLLYWSYDPDVQALKTPRDQKVEPFAVHERLLHFIDIELFQPGERKRGYRHDLSGKPQMDQIPRDPSDPRYQQAGMLPLRIEHCYEQLVESIRAGRLHADGLDQQRGQTATYWAGYLAHYLADNTQPHHSTVDYKSQSYFANRRKAPNVHAEMEYRMLDDEQHEFPELRSEYWPLFEAALKDFEDPIEAADPFMASLQVSYISYDALPLIGEAAMHAAGQKGTPDQPEGDIGGDFDTESFFRYRGTYRGREMSVMEMKAQQTAWAVRRIETTLRQAWRDATGE